MTREQPTASRAARSPVNQINFISIPLAGALDSRGRYIYIAGKVTTPLGFAPLSDGLDNVFRLRRSWNLARSFGLRAFGPAAIPCCRAIFVFDAGGNGRDEFTNVDIGVNNEMKGIPGSLMLATFAGGSTSFGFGRDLGLGGTNSSAFGFFGTQPGSTVTVDGKAIIKDGKLITGG